MFEGEFISLTSLSPKVSVMAGKSCPVRYKQGLKWNQ